MVPDIDTEALAIVEQTDKALYKAKKGVPRHTFNYFKSLIILARRS